MPDQRNFSGASQRNPEPVHFQYDVPSQHSEQQNGAHENDGEREELQVHRLQRQPESGRTQVPGRLKPFHFRQRGPIIPRSLPGDARLIVEDRLEDPSEQQQADRDSPREAPKIPWWFGLLHLCGSLF